MINRMNREKMNKKELELKIGDLVILKENTKKGEKFLRGGYVLKIIDNVVIIKRTSGAMFTYKIEEVRPLLSKDIPKGGIEIY